MSTKSALNQGIPAEHFTRLLAASDADLEKLAEANNKEAKRLWSLGTESGQTKAKTLYAYVDTADAILDHRHGIVRTAKVETFNCNGAHDYDCNGICYGCGKQVARSVASYM